MFPGAGPLFAYDVRVRSLRLKYVTRVVSVAGVLGAVYACRAPTEMTIRITTAVPCSTLRGVGIAAAPTSADAEHRIETRFYAAQTTQCDSDSVVGTLVLTPGSTSFSVVVVAGVDSEVTTCTPPLYAGCIVARRRLAFVDHRSLDVPIVLTRDCLDVPCNSDTSCVHGNCKSVETTCDDASCTQVGVSPAGDGGGVDSGRMDAGGGADGEVTDAAVEDAKVDAADAADGAVATTFSKHWMCSGSPGCFMGGGTPAPCTCMGPVTVDADAGVMSIEMMTLDCQSGAPRCDCLIEGQVANTVPNSGFCSPSQYGACCSH